MALVKGHRRSDGTWVKPHQRSKFGRKVMRLKQRVGASPTSAGIARVKRQRAEQALGKQRRQQAMKAERHERRAGKQRRKRYRKDNPRFGYERAYHAKRKQSIRQKKYSELKR